MGEPTYDDVRRARADRPAGGNFLSAKEYAENATLDVKVTGTEVRPAYIAPGSQPKADQLPDIYWQADVEGKEGATTLVKENSFMSDYLEEHDITDPTGHLFRLVVTAYKGNRSFKVSKVLA
jgi:hypothetical protein